MNSSPDGSSSDPAPQESDAGEEKKTQVKGAPIKTSSGKSRSELQQEMSKLMEEINKAEVEGKQKVNKNMQRLALQTKKSLEAGVDKDKTDIPIDGDYINGSRVFMRNCATCHSLESSNMGPRSVMGPPLGLIYGRKAGSDKYFEYSESYLSSNRVWNARNLFNYLENPQKYFTSTKCLIKNGGLKDEGERADIIRFLKLFTKNLRINLDLKNREVYGNDYVDKYNSTQKDVSEQLYKRMTS